MAGIRGSIWVVELVIQSAGELGSQTPVLVGTESPGVCSSEETLGVG